MEENNSQYLIDSNILIAYFRKEELDFLKANQILESLGSFHISEHCLFEIGTVLLLKENRLVSQKALKFILNNQSVKIINLNDEEFNKLINQFPHPSKKLSMTDMSLLVLAKSRQLELVSFDEELMKVWKIY